MMNERNVFYMKWAGILIVVTYVLVGAAKQEPIIDMFVAFGVLVILLAAWYITEKHML